MRLDEDVRAGVWIVGIGYVGRRLVLGLGRGLLGNATAMLRQSCSTLSKRVGSIA